MKRLARLTAIAALAASTNAVAETRSMPLSWTPPSGETPGPVAGSRALLVTGPGGASMHLTSRGLTPGNAVTIWFVALQNPHLCQKNPCTPFEAMGMAEMETVAVNGGGTVVAADGTVEVSAHLPAGDVPTNLFDTDLVTPESAEYHLVIHDHGPLIPELAADMLSSFRGGCTLESVPPHYPDSARSDGAGGPNACVSRQVALFVPGTLSN
ncbi:MAG: hypothetical protein AAFQ54_08495 [Pseudomonadota bacterium]